MQAEFRSKSPYNTKEAKAFYSRRSYLQKKVASGAVRYQRVQKTSSTKKTFTQRQRVGYKTKLLQHESERSFKRPVQGGKFDRTFIARASSGKTTKSGKIVRTGPYYLFTRRFSGYWGYGIIDRAVRIVAAERLTR
jgi:hypothetical protein